MEKKIEVGILGYGKMGKVYAEAFTANPYTHVKSVFNHTEKRRDELKSNNPDAEYFTDWKKLVDDPEIDAVGICTPTNDRLEQIRYCLERGKHVILEKAMCLDMKEAVEIYEMAEKSDCLLWVGSELRYHPVIRKAQELLPGLGKVFYVSIDYSMFREEIKWKHKNAAGGGVLRELGQHFLDVMRDWFGDPVSVYGRNRVLNPGREVEDLSTSIFTYPNDVEVLIQDNYWEHRRNTYTANIFGEKGQLEIELSSYDTDVRKVILYDNQGGVLNFQVELPEITNCMYPGHMDTFRHEIDIFTDLVRNGKKDMSSLDMELSCISAICGSYLSSEEHREVLLPIR